MIYPQGSLCYNTFLPFLGQMADRRAFEPVVFLVASCQRGVPMPCELKVAGEGPRRARTPEKMLFDRPCFTARNCTCGEGTMKQLSQHVIATIRFTHPP